MFLPPPVPVWLMPCQTRIKPHTRCYLVLQWVPFLSIPLCQAAVLWALLPVVEAFGNGVMSSIMTAPPRRCPGAASSPESRTAGLCGFQGMKKNSTGKGSFPLLAISAQGCSSPTRLDMPGCSSLQCV